MGSRGAHGRLTNISSSFTRERASSIGPKARSIACCVSLTPIKIPSSVMERTLSARLTHGCFSTTFVVPPPASIMMVSGYTSAGTLPGYAIRPLLACTCALLRATSRGSFTRRYVPCDVTFFMIFFPPASTSFSSTEVKEPVSNSKVLSAHAFSTSFLGVVLAPVFSRIKAITSSYIAPLISFFSAMQSSSFSAFGGESHVVSRHCLISSFWLLMKSLICATGAPALWWSTASLIDSERRRSCLALSWLDGLIALTTFM
mmetsp:Transcript_60060/g.133852  ORF Transcript_60060/g.133852 Transcript_60060/m.133852 type:complete len:259 (+) Transcript_60060:177-953(+)